MDTSMRFAITVDARDPIRGIVQVEGGGAAVRGFAGWLDLLAAMEDLLQERPDASDRRG